VSEWKFDPRLAEVYGVCVKCGAHRVIHHVIETHLDGCTTDITRLLCSREPVEHYTAKGLYS
jgi:hypothetical protein